MTNWTKGPWAVTDGRNPRVTSEKGEIAICTYGAENLEDTDYNAHLIAAAPELYEALEELRVAMTAILEGKPFRCLDETMIRAIAALSKARGEAQ